jgi:HlyD family secretion protein
MNDETKLDMLLGSEHRRRWWRRGSLWIAAALLLAAAGGYWVWQQRARAAAAPVYVSTPIKRGTLAISVTATGTLQPTRSVAVGSELSGTVTKVLVDVNDPVRKGQLLVLLDTARLQDAVAGARADLAAALARQRQAEATLQQARATLARYEEVARLSGGKVPSASELDGARADAERAAAEQASAVAGVAQVRTAVSSAETNLAKASIRSPIDGIVLARNVEPGNAVAASLQAVTLFTLAEDLTTMKLSVNVDEADVGQLRAGQNARFTVAAQPGRSYPAKVTRVAYGSTTTDNVVTYTTQLDVDNTDLTLRPGMTATATIAADERTGVLLAPNTALRFTPAVAPVAASSAFVSQLMPRPPRSTGRRGAGTAAGADGTVWVLRDGRPVALAVKKGLSDGRQTEVSGDGVVEGLNVVTDQTSRSAP